VARMQRPDFVLRRDEDIELKPAELAPMAGSYKEDESGFAMSVELVGGHLRATLSGEAPVVLVPVGPTRFRIEGMPAGFAVSFQLEGGKAVALTMEMPGGQAHTLKRQ